MCHKSNIYFVVNYVILLFLASKVSSKVVKADISVKKGNTKIKKEEAAAKVKSENGELK